MSGSLRQYQDLWLRVASVDKPAPVRVVCHRHSMKRLVLAVRKEKAIANRLRKDLGMPEYGKMWSTYVFLPDNKVEITFSLYFNGDLL